MDKTSCNGAEPFGKDVLIRIEVEEDMQGFGMKCMHNQSTQQCLHVFPNYRELRVMVLIV